MKLSEMARTQELNEVSGVARRRMKLPEKARRRMKLPEMARTEE